jgi:hypothetical protein
VASNLLSNEIFWKQDNLARHHDRWNELFYTPLQEEHALAFRVSLIPCYILKQKPETMKQFQPMMQTIATNFWFPA